jgi:uncharacterized protein
VAAAGEDAVVTDRGLDGEGFIRREGDLGLVRAPFAALVEDFRRAAQRAFAGRGLDSLYLYGSIPRGTARPGWSDLDGQVLLDRDPTEADRATVRDLEASLAAEHPEVSDVGILLDSRAALVDPADRHDGGFHLRVLCTPLWGPDAGQDVAPHRPDWDLARHVQGDWRGAFARLRARAAAPVQDHQVLCRAVGRRLTRVAFTWVMPRWGGWTSDPRTALDVVAEHEPAWAEPMALAVRLGWEGVDDIDAARELLGGFTDTLLVRGQELGARSGP